MFGMKPRLLLSLCVLAFLSSACEVAELPPLAEVRDARDSTGTDSAPADTDGDSATPDLSEDTADTEPTEVFDVLEDTAGETSAPVEDAEVAEVAEDAEVTEVTEDTAEVEDTEPNDTTSSDVAPDTAPDTNTDTATTCTPVLATHPVVASPHVATCSAVTYETEPPTSGPHYPVWAAFKTYGAAINPGFLVHALEHGAIVITWSCPSGCETNLAALQAMLDARAADPLCDPLVKHRVIVAPRPTQDVALMAWGWGASWKADCFDLPSLSNFIDAWYAKGPENVCAQGVDIETILPDNAWYCPP